MNINISQLPQSPSAMVGKQPQTQAANGEFKALMGEFAMPENESTPTATEGIVNLPLEPVTDKDTVESIQHHAQDSLRYHNVRS